MNSELQVRIRGSVYCQVDFDDVFDAIIDGATPEKWNLIARIMNALVEKSIGPERLTCEGLSESQIELIRKWIDQMKEKLPPTPPTS